MLLCLSEEFCTLKVNIRYFCRLFSQNCQIHFVRRFPSPFKRRNDSRANTTVFSFSAGIPLQLFPGLTFFLLGPFSFEVTNENLVLAKKPDWASPKFNRKTTSSSWDNRNFELNQRLSQQHWHTHRNYRHFRLLSFQEIPLVWHLAFVSKTAEKV